MVRDAIFDILPDKRYSKGYGLRYRGHRFEAFKSVYMSYKCGPQMNMTPKNFFHPMRTLVLNHGILSHILLENLNHVNCQIPSNQFLLVVLSPNNPLLVPMIILSSVSLSLTGFVLSSIDPLFFNLIKKGLDFIVFIRSSIIKSKCFPSFPSCSVSGVRFRSRKYARSRQQGGRIK